MGTESLRDSLEAASAAMADSTSAPAAETVIESATTSSGDNSTESGPISSTGTNATETGAISSTQRADGRNDKGQFASKTTADNDAGQAAPTKAPPTAEGVASSTPPPVVAEPTKTEPPKPGEPDTTHAPSSWPIGARQNWDKVPPDVRKLVHTRELQAAQAISKGEPARRFQDEVQRTLQPIERAIQARGTTPQKLIASYVQFDQALTSRDPATQAHAIAQVMTAYGVDPGVVADALQGKIGPRQAPPQTVDEIRHQLREEMRTEWQNNQRQAEYKNHATRVQEFAKGVDPILFNDDVRHDMAALIEAGAGRGVELSLQEAFDRAVMANPEARAIVQQREAAKRAATGNPATKRAEAAASSVKSRPATAVGGDSRGSSLRADLEAQAAAMSGRT